MRQHRYNCAQRSRGKFFNKIKGRRRRDMQDLRIAKSCDDKNLAAGRRVPSNAALPPATPSSALSFLLRQHGSRQTYASCRKQRARALHNACREQCRTGVTRRQLSATSCVLPRLPARKHLALSANQRLPQAIPHQGNTQTNRRDGVLFAALASQDRREKFLRYLRNLSTIWGYFSTKLCG